MLDNVSKTIEHFFPNLHNEIRQYCIDPRRQGSIIYSIEEIIMAAVYMYMMRKKSRNSINEDRSSFHFSRNYKALFGLKLPHMDTVNEVLEKLDEGCLQKIRRIMIRQLLSKRVFHKYRLGSKYFTIAIDGSGVFTFTEEAYPGCPYKTSKKGVKTYSQPVLEAKLVLENGFAISIATEWIVNEDGQTKQDCEYKACLRLIDQLKKDYPRLPICLLLDGLYAKHPLMQAITDNKWQYIIVWKDKTLYAQQDLLNHYRQINQAFQFTKEHYHNRTTKTVLKYEGCIHCLPYKTQHLYYASLSETLIDITKTDEPKTTRFVFMSSIPVNESNIADVISAGRRRWKIENEGFNIQKNNGYELHHKMNRNNLRAIKNYYLCMQIAHLIDQLYTKSKLLLTTLTVSIQKLWEYFCSALSMIENYCYELQPKKYNYRY